MPLRQDVQDAFATLGLTPEADIVGATKAYKRLALQHHPDRNHGDPSATQRFQQACTTLNHFLARLFLIHPLDRPCLGHMPEVL